jgi:calcineurin-like phosphoesterase family protein
MKLEMNRAGSNIWITSDTHYNHKNICRGVSEWGGNGKNTRDFPTLEKMNDAIVSNINAVVRPEDILIHLGDWSFGGIENVSKFRERIVCENIHLVLGNHDHHIKRNTDNLQSLFASVSRILDLEIVAQRTSGHTKHRFTMCHFPICSWEDMNRGVIHLHGHVHLPMNKRLHAGKSMDVGVDGNNLHPHNMFDIISIMSKQPIATTALSQDHHLEEVR